MPQANPIATIVLMSQDNNTRYFTILFLSFAILITTIAAYFYGRYVREFVSSTVFNVQSRNSVNVNACQGGDAHYSLTHVGNKDVCHLTHIDGGYKIEYPNSWTFRVWGINATNAIFNEGQVSPVSRQLLVHVVATRLPIEEVDRADYNYDGYKPSPIVDSRENILNREIKELGKKKVLSLETELRGENIRRYFVLRERSGISSLYVFVFNNDEKDFVRNVETAISSMTFIE